MQQNERMRKQNNKAFTLIEVIVAASILSITIFGVYKLIWENTKLISNKEQYSFANTFFPSLQECIEYTWTWWLAWNTTYHFDFWENWDECNRTSSFTRNIILDNVEYTLSGTTSDDILTKINWTLEVSSDTVRPIQKQYTQLP